MAAVTEWMCWTDGSCKSEGAGGWGFVVKSPAGETTEGHGSAQRTLAKIMEYQAVAEALAVVPDGARVVVFADNQSLVEGLSKRLAAWRSNGCANVDEAIVESVRRIAARDVDVRFQWVRGHNENAGNERADALAAQGAREAKASSPRRGSRNASRGR